MAASSTDLTQLERESVNLKMVISQNSKSWRSTTVVEHLLRLHKALGSVPTISTTPFQLTSVTDTV